MSTTAAPTITDLLALHSWSVFDIDPHGRVLAGSDESGTTQLVEISPNGQRAALTALPNACSGRYLRGERAVVVEHDDDGNERAQLSLLSLDPLPSQPVGLDDLQPLVHDPAYIHSLVDVRPGGVVYATNRRNGVDFDVVVLDLAADAEQVLYDGGGAVSDVNVDGTTAVVTVLSLQPASTQVHRVDDGRIHAITAADEHAMHIGATVLPGTDTVVMSSNSGRDFRSVVRVDGDGDWSTLVAADDHDISVLPSPDASLLLVIRHIDGANRVALHDASGALRTKVRLPADGVVTPVWAPSSDQVALGLQSPTRPGDVLVLDTTSGEVHTVVDSTEQMSAGVRDALIEPTSTWVPARDGEQIPCFVYHPPAPASGVDGSLQGSVVMNIHGGPEAQAQRMFSPVNQALAIAGHVVLVPNVRGSTGYGKRWYSLDDVRLRLESVRDLVDLRAWVPTVGGDLERVALFGVSYGGYMVLAGLSMYPGLWAAGVEIVGMSSLVSFLENTSDYRRALREREYGSLQHDREFLEQASPLTYLEEMTTPLFVVHGANDPRVPLSESEQIKAALDTKGVPCELLVYDDEGHGLAKRANRLEAYPQFTAFLADQLRA